MVEAINVEPGVIRDENRADVGEWEKLADFGQETEDAEGERIGVESFVRNADEREDFEDFLERNGVSIENGTIAGEEISLTRQLIPPL